MFPFPTTIKEMRLLGWTQADVILFSGDAFVDHPAFGIAIIARVLENAGYKVAIVPQPNWQDDLRDFKKLGTPRLFFGVSSGNMDSMINHYTANKRLRSNDAYTVGNEFGKRPDYAVTVYSKIIKKLYPNIPLVIGGIEASLRRFTHYDYWNNTLKPSVLIDSNADILVYGMGEKSILEIADRLNNGNNIDDIHNVPQTCYITKNINSNDEKKIIKLSSYQECIKSKKAFAKNFVMIEENSNKINQDILVEPYEDKYIVCNPSYPPLAQKELDKIYELPFTRKPHPKYFGKKPIPAFEMIKDSVTIHRGCFGGCSFCTISAHQGKFISSRSQESILSELKNIASQPNFKGHITDLGGPSANMYLMKGINLKQCANCRRPSCIYPDVCKNLNTNYTALIKLYNDARKIKSIKKITIGSGIRYDLIFDDNNKPINNSALDYLTTLIKHHVSGRLKVAPEHVSDKVLKSIRKNSFKSFLYLYKIFYNICEENNLNYQLIPYFISSLPECSIDDMAELSLKAREHNLIVEQVQDFTPTPMTLASVMYYTEMDPYSFKKIFVAKSIEEKKLQQLFFFIKDKEKRKELSQKLTKLKRLDIVKRLKI